jgi:hypothetical protein
MSLYRQAGRASGRAVAAAAVAGLLAGGLGGYLAGSSGDDAPEPSVAAAVADLREGLRPVRSALDLVGIEYAQAVRGGRVVAATEYAAARSSVQRARIAFAAQRADVAALSPRGARAIEAGLARLERLIAARAPAERVRAAASATDAALVAVAPR